MRNLSDRVALTVAQGIVAGRSPWVPGTAGTLAAVPLYWAAARWLPGPLYPALIAAVAAAGIWSAGVAARVLRQTDPRPVVIDEIAGYLLTMAGHPPEWPRILAGFLLFRVFDVLKPPPVRRLEGLRGGLGIVADDLGAAVYANLALHLAAWTWAWAAAR
ncbi:MAG: phosphatidylglycerophosphatase A [Acidobacteria bacterium]|nr:phosphatidylglycerophosphatase A [Acidobacteriota bacterium]